MTESIVDAPAPRRAKARERRRAALRFVVTPAVVSLFADMVYEGVQHRWTLPDPRGLEHERAAEVDAAARQGARAIYRRSLCSRPWRGSASRRSRSSPLT